MTTLLVLRLRYKLVTSGRLNRLLLAEEATGLAFSGLGQEVALNAEEALALLEAEASSNMDESARIRQIEAKALRKLKHPSRSRKLRSFLDS